MADRYAPPRRHRTPPPVPTDEQKQAAAKAEYEKLRSARSGGVYIPPARLRALQAQITDTGSKEYQRLRWDALKKSLNGLVNKASEANMKQIAPELFAENLIRGRGLLCQSLIKAQATALPFTPTYACLAAIVNSKIPSVGELLINRLLLRFRKAFKRNDKDVCRSVAFFIAHLTNQQVCDEITVGQILILLLNKPTDVSVEIAVALVKEVGAFLEDMAPNVANLIFEQFRKILQEADIDKRTQWAVEVLFQTRKDKFKDNPAVKAELDLIEEEDQIKHRIEINGELEAKEMLNIFKFDPDWDENEAQYKKLKAEILDGGSEYETGSEADSSSEDEEDKEQKKVEIKDQSNRELVELRKIIYLTLQSSASAQETVTKLKRLRTPNGLENEVSSMIIECCAKSHTYTKYHGEVAETCAKINRTWQDWFERDFERYYETIHRHDSNSLRNIAKLFGHCLATDAIGWHVLSVIKLTEEDTTASSRIFLKILFQEVAAGIGMPALQARMKDQALRPSIEGMFPTSGARNIRFAINYFTSIEMGALSVDMREHLENMPKTAPPALTQGRDDSDSETVSSYSSFTGSSYSSRSRSRSRSRDRSPPRRRSDDFRRRDDSRRRDGSCRSRSLTRTPPRRGANYRGRSRSFSSNRSRSRSPPPRRNRRRSSSYSSRGRGRSRSPARSDYSRRTRSRSPLSARRGASGRDRSRSRSFSSSGSRSRSPPPRRNRRRPSSHSNRSRSRSRITARSDYSRRTRSRSPLPARRGAATSRSRSRSSLSPRRSVSRSPSRSRSPPPSRRRRRRGSSASSGGSVPRKRYRRD